MNTHKSTSEPTNLDTRVGVANGSSVMSHDVLHSLRSGRLLHHLAQLELTLNLGDTMHCESALHVVEQAERLPSLLDADHVWK